MNHTTLVRRHFDAVADTWEAHYAGNGRMKSRLSRFARQLRARVDAPADVLDFGCGPGDLSWHLAQSGYRVCGVDASEAMIARALKRFNAPNLRFLSYANSGQAEVRLPFSEAAFHACIASSVLEYLNPLERYLGELRRVTQLNGVLAVTVPNTFHPVRVLELVEKTVLHRLYSEPRLMRKPRSGYLLSSVNRYSINRWRTFLRASGWLVESVSGWSDPLLLICCRAI